MILSSTNIISRIFKKYIHTGAIAFVLRYYIINSLKHVYKLKIFVW